MRAIVAIVAIVVALGLAPSTAFAQLSEAGQRFEKLRPQHVEVLRAHFRGYRAMVDGGERVRATPQLAPLGPENAVTAADRLAAAVKTDAGGAEAGIVVSPLKLFGLGDSPVQPSLTVASLEGRELRVGAGATVEWTRKARDAGDLRLDQCKLDEAKLDAELTTIRRYYAALCRRLEEAGDGLLQKAGPNARNRLDFACREFPAPEVERAFGAEPGSKLVSSSAALVQIVKRAGLESFDQKAARDEIDEARDKLDAWLLQQASVTSCDSDAMVKDALVARFWSTPRHKLGLNVHADLFSIQLGFQPDPETELSRGELHKLQGRVEYELGYRRVTLTLGGGFGRSRDEPGGEWASTIKPSLGVRCLVGRLDGGKLAEAATNAEVPLFSLGLSATAEIAAKVPEHQSTRWNEVDLTAFADFRVSKELSFRLGVPLHGEIAIRKADVAAMPPVIEKKALQWSVPVFVATVLSL